MINKKWLSGYEQMVERRGIRILILYSRGKNVNTPETDQVETTINTGTKYLRFMMDRYFDDLGYLKVE